jgi:hypothetical protein
VETSATIKIPTQKEIEKIIEELRSVEKKISDFTIVLQPAEREALVSMAPGGEGAAAAVAHLSNKKKIAVDGTSIQAMEDHFMLAERMKTLYREVYLLQKRLDDTIRKSQSEAWTTLTRFAAELRKIAESDPRFAIEYEPVDAFVSGGGQAHGSI